MMESTNQNKGSQSLNDVLYRRLMNRERQRRYRERKRLKADTSKTYVTNQSSQVQIASPPPPPPPPPPPMSTGHVERVVTRVHCARDWKKDARTIHVAKQLAMSNGPSSIAHHSSAGEIQLMHCPSRTQEAEQTLKSDVPLTNGVHHDGSENVGSKPGRRHWKAEARNKK